MKTFEWLLWVIAIIFISVILISCTDFERKMYEAQQLQCKKPIHSMCEPNETLLICDTANKTECYGKLIEEKVWIKEETIWM